jgi:glycosyltransferase involved in cell wall biosynthesis
MKILYLSCSRYPTEKAYGVTIGNTIEALRKINVETEVGVWGRSKEDEYGNTITSIANRPIRVPGRFYKSNSQIISKMVFSINQLIFGLYFVPSQLNRKKNSVIWTREPLILLPHSLFNKEAIYLIELHHPASTVSRKVIKYLGKRNIVKIIVLNEKSKILHSKMFGSKSVCVIPMGVPKVFFQPANGEKSSKFTIGYVGKGISSGNDNRLYEVVYAANKLQSEKIFQFKFIGLEKEYKLKLISIMKDLKMQSDCIVFVDHINHSSIPKELLTFDVGLLPYGNSTYNSERFPIKLLEYAAAGLPIIATDTPIHRELMSGEFTQFYSKDNPEDLAEAIVKLKEKSKDRMRMFESARQFASQFTYDKRAEKLLALLDSVAE